MRLVLPDDCSACVGKPRGVTRHGEGREGLARAGLGMLHLPASGFRSCIPSHRHIYLCARTDGRVIFCFAASIEWPKILDGTMLSLGDPA